MPSATASETSHFGADLARNAQSYPFLLPAQRPHFGGDARLKRWFRKDNPGRFLPSIRLQSALQLSRIQSSRVGLARSLELSGLCSEHRSARLVACACPCAGGARCDDVRSTSRQMWLGRCPPFRLARFFARSIDHVHLVLASQSAASSSCTSIISNRRPSTCPSRTHRTSAHPFAPPRVFNSSDLTAPLRLKCISGVLNTIFGGIGSPHSRASTSPSLLSSATLSSTHLIVAVIFGATPREHSRWQSSQLHHLSPFPSTTTLHSTASQYPHDHHSHPPVASL